MVKQFSPGNKFLPVVSIAEAAIDWQGLPDEQRELVVVEEGLPYLAGVPELTERAEALLYAAHKRTITGLTHNEDGYPVGAARIQLDRVSARAFIALTAPVKPERRGAPDDVLIREPEVLKMLGISRVTLYRRVKAGELPEACATNPNRWRQSDIAAIIAVGKVRQRAPKLPAGSADDI